MAHSNPFETLLAGLTLMVLGLLEPADIRSPIDVDPDILRVFLQHELTILRPLRQSLHRQLPSQNLVQALIACHQRQIERTPFSQNRAKYQEVVKPILTRSPEALPTRKLNLWAISELHHLFREAEIFVSAYSREAWDMPHARYNI
ncbi:hypothetical protein FGRMN_1723 [Fusarium graminum]|nr:hypothetical protein FGRMN_1723 [Fusarium graminum]